MGNPVHPDGCIPDKGATHGPNEHAAENAEPLHEAFGYKFAKGQPSLWGGCVQKYLSPIYQEGHDLSE